jgi:hypothetical protein
MKEQRSCTNESSLSCPFWLSTEIEMDLLLSLLGVTSDDGLGDSFVGPSALGSLNYIYVIVVPLPVVKCITTHLLSVLSFMMAVSDAAMLPLVLSSIIKSEELEALRFPGGKTSSNVHSRFFESGSLSRAS